MTIIIIVIEIMIPSIVIIIIINTIIAGDGNFTGSMDSLVR